jgi:hypothetical protein
MSSVMPAQAGIHLRLRFKFKKSLDSRLRENDEKEPVNF